MSDNDFDVNMDMDTNIDAKPDFVTGHFPGRRKSTDEAVKENSTWRVTSATSFATNPPDLMLTLVQQFVQHHLASHRRSSPVFPTDAADGHSARHARQ